MDGFPIGGGLLMGPRTEPDAFTVVHTLVWLDGNAKPCWIEGLSLGETPTTAVHFGQETYPCEVTVTLDGTTLHGTLTLPYGGDGNAGTFTAESSGPPPPDPSEE
jgi:hypothetical protein